uniref:Txe/YoeB family addiction module toxin n=1 Tax=Thermosulfurimonas sp. TaxID=2080236 RepID=UPI0025DCEB1F
ECLKSPFSGTGKPEPLKGDLKGIWARRISKEHRLVYTVEEDIITIISCYSHYETVK